jgi:hypothetical protein
MKAKTENKGAWLASFFRLALSMAAAFLLARFVIKLLRRLRSRRTAKGDQTLEPAPAAAPGEQPANGAAQAVPQAGEAEPTEALLESEVRPEGLPEAEGEAAPPFELETEAGAEAGISFGLALGETGVETIPDPYFTVPSNLLVDSFDPRYQFNWQNPTLLGEIYPHRIPKLVDFLAFYTEVDLYKAYRAGGQTDPSIQEKIKAAQAEQRQARQVVRAELEKAIQAKKNSDKYFASITGRDEKNLRFKQRYYVDREIQRNQEKYDQLEDRKNTLLKRIDWYPSEDERREMWRQRADALDPEMEATQAVLNDSQSLRDLLTREAELPQEGTGPPSVEDLTRWELREKRGRWSAMSQEELLEEIITGWLQPSPERFPEWLVYMVIHFSGMRYKSSHGSWAEPRFLLEQLAREDIESRISGYTADQLNQACSRLVQKLSRKSESTPKAVEVRSTQILLKRLQTPGLQARALIQHRTAQSLDDIQNLPNDKACLDRLVQYKAEKEARGDPIPDWVWAEIVKYTPLRLNTHDPDWESSSPQRWKYTNRRWQEILKTWEGKDITAWREKHRQTLELIVTRAVCNEIAENIQHLRGLSPAAGLAAKPTWYLRQASKNPQQAYFKQAPSMDDFKTGASILWLDWVDREPNAWQIAHPLPGFDMTSSGADQGWEIRPANGSFIRTRRKPSRRELKAQGKSAQEVRKIMEVRKVSGNVVKQYLRWTHEATVVEVMDMADGRYVLTFETGKIGVNLRRLGSLAGNPMVFVGYTPGAPQLPPELDRKLVAMLRWDRILPQVNLPERVRPKKATV